MIPLSTLALQLPLSNLTSSATITTHFCPIPSKHHHKIQNYSKKQHQQQRLLAKSSSSISQQTSLETSNSSPPLYHVVDNAFPDDSRVAMLSSASALASAIRKSSTSPVEFLQKIEKDSKSQGLVLPSPDFQRLCLDQFHLFRRIVHPDALLSVYVRPAGSYVMDQLELRRVSFYPKVDGADIVILVGNFSIPTGLRAAEAALSNQEAEAIPEYRAVVFPLVKHPFVVGFLVAEFPNIELVKDDHDIVQLSPEDYGLPPTLRSKSQEIQTSCVNALKQFNFSAEQRLNAISISRSLAMAYVMDQKAMLLQQTTWQNNVRMNNLVEQICGPLSSIRTLTKMLSVQVKKSEISYDILEDIIVQGDHMRDALQQLQDAVCVTRANVLRFNEESLKKMNGSDYAQHGLTRRQFSNDLLSDTSINKTHFGEPHSLGSVIKDGEMPMPPLALAPLKEHNIRPCNASDVVVDLVGAVKPLAHKQKRSVGFSELSPSLVVAVEEPALRQALGNLIEGALLRTHVGGRIEIFCMGAPAGGGLVIIDDDGPDVHYMTQTHLLTPFGAELFSDHMVEDNMTWNFVAGLRVAREILESYGCVVRVVSPRSSDAALGAGGTRIEVWLPSLSSTESSSYQEA